MDISIGIHVGISNTEYHTGPGISKSGLDLVHISPLHYQARYLSPNAPAREETPSLANGTAVHMAVFEPDLFEATYREGPSGKRGTKAWDAAELDAERSGVVLLKTDELADVRAQAASVRAHPLVRELLYTGQAETSVYWKDTASGLLCRARPDWLCLDRGIIADLKTTRDGRPEKFLRSIIEYRYHVQAAFYCEGVREARRQSSRPVASDLSFVFVVVESNYPFATAVYLLSNEFLARGESEFREDVTMLAKCLSANTWPGFPTTAEVLNLPPWFRRDTVVATPTDNNECPF